MPYRILRCLLLLFLFNFAYAEIPGNVLDAADAGLSLMLNSIPEGYESRYGFENREELAEASLSLPYQMYTIHPDMFLGDAAITDEMIVPVDEWRFPVVCSGRTRALLTVAKVKDKWQAVDIGAAQLASEIDAIERNSSSKGNRDIRKIILRLYQIRSDFVVIADSSSVANGTFYPLQSARIGAGGSMKQKSAASSQIFKDLIPALKDRYRDEYFSVK